MKADVRLTVYESDRRVNLQPLTLTNATFDLMLGSCTILERIERSLGRKAESLFVPQYLADVVREKHPGVAVNEPVNSPTIAVNSLLAPNAELHKEILRDASAKDTVFVDSEGEPVFSKLEQFDTTGFAKLKQRKPLRKSISDHALIKFPWELVSYNAQVLIQDFADTKPSLTTLKRVETRGNRISVSDSADLERHVTLDSRSGPIIISDDAEIQSFSRIDGPCYVGKKSKVKSALIREGTTISEECRVSGEIEESIISGYTNKNHEGFIGHSYVGSWVNLGAITTNSDLKNTYGTIKVKIGKDTVDTGSIKIGCFMGDMCKTSIGTMLFSGKSFGVSSQLFGTVTENVPSFTFYAKSLGAESKEFELESAVETQKRMMQRRGVQVTSAYLSMIKKVFEMTRKGRVLAKVKKGKFVM
ncbi:MAG: hypothetical protein M1368_03690 [Thaumarchaeota archaeon]|nr:hypothetical protein [Nitrososphaerota archaeon]